MRVWLIERWESHRGPWPYEDDGQYIVVGFVTSERAAERLRKGHRVTELTRVRQ